MRVASTQMNTNDSAAAMSGEPAAAEIKIQTNNTGSTRSNGRPRLTRAGRTAGGTVLRVGLRPLVEVGPEQRPGGQVGGQHPQLGSRSWRRTPPPSAPRIRRTSGVRR